MTVRYFDPDPVLTGWNYDYLDGSDIWYRAIWDARVFNMFADAVAERWQAMFPWESVPAICTHAAPGNYSLAKWKELYNTFVNAFYTGTNGYWKDGFEFAGDGYVEVRSDGGVNFPVRRDLTYGGSLPLDFPNGYLVDLSALVATYPREITTLAASGTNGQFARFIGSTVTTPTNRAIFGKIFERVAGVWTYSSNRNEVRITAGFGFPDKIDRQGVYDATDPAYDPTLALLIAGDYFTAAWLAAFRDLLNETVVFYHDNCGELNGFASSDWPYRPYWSANGVNNTNSGTGSNTAATDLDYDSLANATSSDREALTIELTDNGVPPFTEVGSKYRVSSFPKIDSLPYPGTTRDLSLYVGPSVPLGTYDDFGDGVSQTEWLLVGSTTTSGTTYLGSRLGSLARPNGAANSGYFVFQNIAPGGFGVYVPNIAAISRWDVSGGFAYTADT